MNCKATDISRALGSAAELVNIGNQVIFQKSESYIDDQDGKITELRREYGMWYLDCRKVPRPTINSVEVMKVCFHRPGR